MQPDWREHASMVVDFEERTRNDQDWRQFCEWLEIDQGDETFMLRLLEALQYACRTFQPERASLSTWISRNFVWARSKVAETFKEWQATREREMSMEHPIGENATIGDMVGVRAQMDPEDVADPADTGSHEHPTHSRAFLQDMRQAVRADDVEPADPRWLAPSMRALVYRSMWRHWARRGQSRPGTSEEHTNEKGLVPPRMTHHVALERQRWWRLMVT